MGFCVVFKRAILKHRIDGLPHGFSAINCALRVPMNTAASLQHYIVTKRLYQGGNKLGMQATGRHR